MRRSAVVTRWFMASLIALAVWPGFTSSARAADWPTPPTIPPKALETIRHLAIQHNGRHKPFDSFARETLSQITGSPSLGRQDPVATVLGIIAEPQRAQAAALIHIPFAPLREPLGMEPHATHIAYNDLVASRKLMRMLPPIVQKQQRDEKLTILENETMDAFQRFVAFNRLIEQQLELVPPPSTSPLATRSPDGLRPPLRGGVGGGGMVPQPSGSWQPIPQDDVWQAVVDAVRRGDGPAIESAAARLSQTLRAASPAAYPAAWRLRLEVVYNRSEIFRIAWIVYLIAAGGFLLSLGVPPPSATGLSRPPSFAGSPGSVAGMGALIIAFVLHGVGIMIRVVLGGRPPVSNFFETMLWLPFVGVVLALVFERIYRARYFGLAAAVLAAITLALSEHVPLDSSIAPVVAVLRSNLWLTIHVLTIVASYGALALATVLAHIYGGLYLAGRTGRKALEPLDLFLYRTIQVGVVLLAGGIMLGAVWANASWGRYWGWDPKETWALITLLWFLAILHGRFAGWLTGVGVALATIGGFFLLLMTYYGVSFYLVGLHSYAGGHAKPLPALLVAYLIAEAAFLVVVGVAAFSRRHA